MFFEPVVVAEITAKRQLPALTGIRFFLALWVVVYHQSPSLTQAILPYPLLHWITAILRTGYAAVGVFFVLSGFVLAYNYDLRTLLSPRNLKRFAIARFSRIYPAYLVGLLLFVPLGLYRFTTQVSSDNYYGLTNFILSLILVQAWIPSAALTWNFPGWSLSNEAFFYATLPIFGAWLYYLLGSFGKRKTNILAMFLASFAALWILSLAVPLFAVVKPLPHFGDVPATAMDLAGAGPGANFVRYEPLLRIPEFCVGVLLARLYQLISPGAWLWNRGMCFYFPGFAIALLVLSNADRIPYPLAHNGLLLPAWALMIFGLALDGGWLARLLAAPTLVFLGNASYAMYILHAPISAWMSIGFVRVLKLTPFGIMWFVCYVTACVVLSCIFFQVFEEPLHRGLRARLNRWAKIPRTATQQHVAPGCAPLRNPE